MTGKASVPNVFASATTVKTTDWDANWSSLVSYANDPTNRISFSADTGAANVYTLAPSPAVAYSNNTIIWFLAAHTNTATSTANANGLGALTIFIDAATGPQALIGGEIVANNWHGLVFDSTLNANAGGWHLLNPAVFQPSFLTSKASPVAADSILIMDSAASNLLKRSTITALKTPFGTWTLGTEAVMNPVSNSAVSSQAHGLGRVPDMVVLWLQNLTAEIGFSIGDRAFLQLGPNVQVNADATNTTITVNASTVTVNRKDTGVSASITLANWKAVAAPLIFSTAFP